MNIVQIGDIHLSDTRIKEFEILICQLADEIVKQSPDLIVFTGDMFIHRDKLTPKQVELSRKFFNLYLKEYPKIIITGNHDISMSVNKIDSLSAIFSSDEQIVYTEIGSFKDIGDYRFHMYPYPSKSEMSRLNINDLSEMYNNNNIFDLFNLSKEKKNVLIYHGTMIGFNVSENYTASESSIAIGKDLYIPESFWNKFDAVMAGHLHKYQAQNNAVYSGVHFPLTFADTGRTGFVVWKNLSPEFVGIEQKFPYITIDIGKLISSPTGLTDEAVRKVGANEFEYKDARVRIKYKINSNLSGNVDHTKISEIFSNAKEIKIVPEYFAPAASSDKLARATSFDDFKDYNIFNIVTKYIDDYNYHPEVKKIAKKVEDVIKEKYTTEDESGIHFKLKSLSLDNFKCFGPDNRQINFDKLDTVIGVFGKNKVGKSALIEGIVWALFGMTIRNRDASSVIRNGETSTKVELEFESHSDEYKIIRKRNKNNSNLNLFVKDETNNWNDISGATMLETQETINRLAGTFEIFISTVYSPQNNIDLLVNKKPSERKKIILDCLQIDVLSRRQAEIQETKKAMRNRISFKRGELVTLSGQLSDLLGQKPSDRLKVFEDMLEQEQRTLVRLNSHLLSYSKKVYEYEGLVEEQELVSKEIEELKVQIRKLELKISAKNSEASNFENILSDKTLLDDGVAKIKGLEQELKVLDDELRIVTDKRKTVALLSDKEKDMFKNYNETIKLLEENRKVLVSGLSTFKTLNCPKPDCPMNEKIIKDISERRIALDELDTRIQVKEKEYLFESDILKTRKEKLEKDIENSIYNGKTYQNIQFKLRREQEKDWVSLQNKIILGDEYLKSINELVLVYKSQLDSLRKDRSNKVILRGEIITKISTINSYKKEVEKLEKDINLCNQNIFNYTEHISVCKRDLKEIQQLQKKVMLVQDKIKYLTDYLGHCTKYSEIVGKYGVLFSIVDKALPIIEKFAQDILSETTNGMISVSIDSYKTLIKGDKIDEVVISIADSKGRRDVREASGAELVLVSLALRAALSHLLSIRMGSKVELFIVDEGFGAFDDENIISVKDFLRKLGEKFNKVLFITHVPELKDIAQSIIKVHGNSLISTYEVLHGDKVYDY